MFPEHDLTSRKDFIKDTVRKVITEENLVTNLFNCSTVSTA